MISRVLVPIEPVHPRTNLRHEVVAGVAVRDLHDVAGQAELVDVGGE